MTTTRSVIGYGRFGRLAARFLARSGPVLIADRKPIGLHRRNERVVPLAEAAGAHVVILAIPVNRMPQVLKAIAPSLRPGAVVIDVCAVKEYSAGLMKKLLPDRVFALGSHPLFGPDSVGSSLKGKQIVLCPVRIPGGRLKCIMEYLAGLGLETLLMTPADHDALMARTLFLTQFLGRGVAPLIRSLPPGLGTVNFRLLRRISTASTADSRELFDDLKRYNRRTRTITRRILSELSALAR